MKYEEDESITTTIPRYQNCLIYFLINRDIVVYVGQTRKGLQRPFQHLDKDFEEVKFILCDEADLDNMEDIYIKKYNPIYNKTYNFNCNYSLVRARNKFREKYNTRRINVPVIRRILKKNNISTLFMNDKEYITCDDYKAIEKDICDYLNK